MGNQIKNLEIQNFKSIKHLQLECKRVNILIGEPNVGKSNILEALSLLGAEFETNDNKFLSSFIRYENFNNLFYDKDIKNDILVETDKNIVLIKSNSKYDAFGLFSSKISEEIEYIKNINDDNWNYGDIRFKFSRLHTDGYGMAMQTDEYEKTFPFIKYNSFDNYKKFQNRNLNDVFFKKYDFKVLEKHDKTYPNFLNPPFGDNLLSVLYQNKALFKEVGSFFGKNGFKLGIDLEENKLKIQKSIDEFSFIHFPYSSMADTLQRIIFYLTAIESNKNSVLLFEEPEAHSFPPYVGMLADRIAQDEDNQYFIATHSPLLLDSIIEGTPKEDRNIIITYFKDYETKIKVLKEEEIKEFLNDKIDLFYNINRFIDEYESPFAD